VLAIWLLTALRDPLSRLLPLPSSPPKENQPCACVTSQSDSRRQPTSRTRVRIVCFPADYVSFTPASGPAGSIREESARDPTQTLTRQGPKALCILEGVCFGPAGLDQLCRVLSSIDEKAAGGSCDCSRSMNFSIPGLYPLSNRCHWAIIG